MFSLYFSRYANMNFTVKIKAIETDINFQSNDYYLSFAILLISISVFGIIGNIISFLVLRRIEKRCSSYTYLTGKIVFIYNYPILIIKINYSFLHCI